jgi:hypothetical protein
MLIALCVSPIWQYLLFLQEWIRNSPQFELNLGLLFTPELEHQRYTLPGNIIPILMPFAIQINDISTLKLNLHTLLVANLTSYSGTLPWYLHKARGLPGVVHKELMNVKFSMSMLTA